MITNNQQPRRMENLAGQPEKLRLPATEFFYTRAMERSAEIRAQVQEAKTNSKDQDEGETDR